MATLSPTDIHTYLQAEYGLDASQALAANHLDGPALALAAAGSGKTSTLTARVTHLIRFYQVPAERILCITFTNKATQNMLTKITRKLGDGKPMPTISTIHSLGLGIIRSHPKMAYDALASLAKVAPDPVDPTKPFNIKDYYLSIWSERNCDNAFKKVCEEMGGKAAQDTLDNIYYLTNRGFTPASYEALRVSNMAKLKAEKHYLTETETDQWQGYLRSKLHNRTMDFQDMMLLANTLLEQHPRIQEKYFSRWAYILQDEAQDASPLQWHLLELLTNPTTGNLFAVGDSSQSIMGFQGGDIELIRSFQKEFKGKPTKCYHLGNNYRSHPTIINVANALEGELIKNHPAPMVAQAKISGDTPALKYSKYPDSNAEAADIVRVIRSLADIPVNAKLQQSLRLRPGIAANLPPQQPKPFKLKDICILVRTKMMIPALENALLMGRVPYYVKDGKSLLQSKEIADLLSYLRLLINPYDEESFERAAQVPKRGFGAESAKKLCLEASRSRTDVLSLCRFNPKLNTFHSFISKMREMSEKDPKGIANLITLWVEGLGYINEITKMAKDADDSLRRQENLRRFSTLAQEIVDTSSFENLGEFIDHITLMQDAGASSATDDRVHVMTAHSAKGLEYEVVFAPGFFEGSIPHQKSIKNENELAEEARLAYVIITRAIRQLRISRPYVYSALGGKSQVETRDSRFYETIRTFFEEDSNKL